MNDRKKDLTVVASRQRMELNRYIQERLYSPTSHNEFVDLYWTVAVHWRAVIA